MTPRGSFKQLTRISRRKVLATTIPYATSLTIHSPSTAGDGGAKSTHMATGGAPPSTSREWVPLPVTTQQPNCCTADKDISPEGLCYLSRPRRGGRAIHAGLDRKVEIVGDAAKKINGRSIPAGSIRQNRARHCPGVG